MTLQGLILQSSDVSITELTLVIKYLAKKPHNVLGIEGL